MSRPRRALAILGPVRLAVALAIGLALTLLSAWWIALEPGVLPLFPLRRPVDRMEVRLNVRPEGPHIANLPRPSLWQSEGEELTTWTDHGNTVYASSESILRRLDPGHPESGMPWGNLYTERDSRPAWVRGLRAIEGQREVYAGTAVYEHAFGWPRSAFVRRTMHDGMGGTRETGSLAVNTAIADVLSIQPTARAPISPVPIGIVTNSVVFAALAYALLSVYPVARGVRRRLTGRCHACGYQLAGITADRCPECGRAHRRPAELLTG